MKKLMIFKKTLLNPKGLNSDHSLFYSICYSIRYDKNLKK